MQTCCEHNCKRAAAEVCIPSFVELSPNFGGAHSEHEIELRPQQQHQQLADLPYKYPTAQDPTQTGDPRVGEADYAPPAAYIRSARTATPLRNWLPGAAAPWYQADEEDLHFLTEHRNQSGTGLSELHLERLIDTFELVRARCCLHCHLQARAMSRSTRTPPHTPTRFLYWFAHSRIASVPLARRGYSYLGSLSRFRWYVCMSPSHACITHLRVRLPPEFVPRDIVQAALELDSAAPAPEVVWDQLMQLPQISPKLEFVPSLKDLTAVHRHWLARRVVNGGTMLPRLHVRSHAWLAEFLRFTM